MGIEDEVRRYWDMDAATYDRSPQHAPTSPMVLAAWRGALETLLPPAPARVLDCGAGTGFLSLIAAELGHQVTATDLSSSMLARLQEKAARRGLEIEVAIARADAPPGTGYAAVMERHLLWTLPDPDAVLRAWLAASAPEATLVSIGSIWGDLDPMERMVARARHRLDRIRGVPNEHHAEYDDAMNDALPLSGGAHPERVVGLVEAAGWRSTRLTRLRDVEWAERLAAPFPDRLLGVPARFALAARGAPASAPASAPATPPARASRRAATKPAQEKGASRSSRRESTRSTASRAPEAGPE